jgi:hypothetical protein
MDYTVKKEICILLRGPRLGAVDRGGYAVKGEGLRPLVCWDCGSNSVRDMDFIVVSVVCCQVQVSAASRSPSRGVLPSVVCLSVIPKPQK